MANLIYSAIASLDGYVADEDGNFDWAAPDEEVHAFVNDLERPVGTYLYGRRMYETMAVWETMALDDEPPVMRDFAEIWRAADKVVYSRTLATASTARTRIEREFDADAVRRDEGGGGARHQRRRPRARRPGDPRGPRRRAPALPGAGGGRRRQRTRSLRRRPWISTCVTSGGSETERSTCATASERPPEDPDELVSPRRRGEGGELGSLERGLGNRREIRLAHPFATPGARRRRAPRPAPRARRARRRVRPRARRSPPARAAPSPRARTAARPRSSPSAPSRTSAPPSGTARGGARTRPSPANIRPAAAPSARSSRSPASTPRARSAAARAAAIEATGFRPGP